MSITYHVNELQKINIEIKRQSAELSKLRKRHKELENIIQEFLNEKEQPGVKFGDFAVVLEKKSKFTIKPKKEKEEDSLKILEECGVEDPKNVLDRLERAKKGDEIEQAKIKVKNVKKKE
jgi:hypothetical protein